MHWKWFSGKMHVNPDKFKAFMKSKTKFDNVPATFFIAIENIIVKQIVKILETELW